MGTRCFGCMRIKENKPICEHCGYDECRENGNHQLPVGTVVGEQYVLGRVLGQGGFGITYIGYDMTMGQTVAVKEYFPSGYAGRDPRKMTRVISYDNTDQNTFASNKRRFLREAESMGKLWNIPQIVKVLRHFEENGTAYIAMEYVEGMDLRMYMKQLGRPMTMEEVYRILGPVIQALDHVHGADLVHRDISPDNIMVMPDGTAKLLDFGAARYVENADAQKDRNTSTQTILKHGFAPPEQYRSHGALGPWTDIYAICATVYYCLTGRIPPEAMNRMMGEGELNWKGIAGLTPSQIKTLEQGMALMPANRIKTARELYQALFADMIANRDRAAQAEKDRLAREERLREARERQSREAEPKAAAKPAKGKNRKKKPFRGIIGFAVLCALIAGLFFLPRVTPFFLKQKITVSNATYTLERNESGITITGYQGALPRDLSIPEEVYGIPVTAIRAGAFADSTTVKSVVIPKGVTVIEAEVFRGCSNLASVRILGNVTSIGDKAFQDCASLTGLYIPEGVVSIGKGAFSGCASLTKVKLPDSLTDLGAEAFMNCRKLEIMTLSRKLTYLKDRVFYGCGSLKEINIPVSVTAIGANAFHSCHSLKRIGSAGNVASIGDFAFYDCTALTKIHFSLNLESIGAGAFQGCTSLQSVTLQKNVAFIGPSAFMNCVALKEMAIPSGITEIDSSVFFNCTALERVEIPDTVTSVSAKAFAGCTGLKEIVLPESVGYLGAEAFYGCSGLTKITMPTKGNWIGDEAFSGCSSLTSITIPKGVPAIRRGTFAGCNRLHTVRLPRECTGRENIPSHTSVIPY